MWWLGLDLGGEGRNEADLRSSAGSGRDSDRARRVRRVADGHVDAVEVVLDLAWQKVVKGTPEEKAKRCCLNNMNVNGEGNVIDAHV